MGVSDCGDALRRMTLRSRYRTHSVIMGESRVGAGGLQAR